MPSKKKKYNARFPAGRIKKIMQSDEEVGKVAQAVPIIISRTLELFVESLLNKTMRITNARNAKTLSTSHMKQCIMSESRFDFLRELVKNVPDINVAEEQAMAAETGSFSESSPNVPQYSVITATSIPTSTTVNNTAIDLSTQSIQHPNNGTINNNPSTTTTITSTSITTLNRNGSNNKRNIIPPYSAYATTATNKTMSSSYTNAMISDEQNQKLMQQPPNFYTEITENETTPNSVIQYTPKLRTQQSVTTNLDIRPPKLKRVDSAPATLTNSNQSIYMNKQNSPYITLPSPKQQSKISASSTTTTATTTPLKFDFTKSMQQQHQPIIATSNEYKASKTIPSLVSIKSNQSATITTINQQKTPQISAVSTNSAAHQFLPQPVVKIDVTNQSIVKIDYSNLDLSKPYNLSTVGTSSSSSTKNNTPTPITPIIDMLNKCNSGPPMFKCTIPAASTLDMDEDYDNI